MNHKCECEHDSHFGAEGHVYAAEFPDSELVKVRTPYATLIVCDSCSEACLSRYHAMNDYASQWGESGGEGR